MQNHKKMLCAIKEATNDAVLKALSGYYIQGKRLIINNIEEKSGIYEFNIDKNETHKVSAVFKEVKIESIPNGEKYENRYFAKIEFSYEFFYENEKYKVSTEKNIKLDESFKRIVRNGIDDIFRIHGYYLEHLRYTDSKLLLDDLIPQEKRIFLTEKGFELPVIQTKSHEGEIDISHSGLGPDVFHVKLEHFTGQTTIKNNRHPLFSISVINSQIKYFVGDTNVYAESFYSNLENTENDEYIPFKI